MAAFKPFSRILIDVCLEVNVSQYVTNIFSILHHRLAPLVIRDIMVPDSVDQRDYLRIEDGLVNLFELLDSRFVGIVYQVPGDQHTVQSVRICLRGLDPELQQGGFPFPGSCRKAGVDVDVTDHS